MRGGVFNIGQRYSEANDKYMKNYDKDKPSKCILYEDATNLNGCAMSQYLLFGVFKWLTRDKIDRLDNNTIQKVNADSCILEVDLEYPEKLNNSHIIL